MFNNAHSEGQTDHRCSQCLGTEFRTAPTVSALSEVAFSILPRVSAVPLETAAVSFCFSVQP